MKFYKDEYIKYYNSAILYIEIIGDLYINTSMSFRFVGITFKKNDARENSRYYNSHYTNRINLKICNKISHSFNWIRQKCIKTSISLKI